MMYRLNKTGSIAACAWSMLTALSFANAEPLNAIAVCIGVDSVGPSYPEPPVKLDFAESDAKLMAEIASREGFDQIKTILTPEAKLERVIEEIRQARAQLAPRGLFLLTFAGHGSYVPDRGHTDEPEGNDETWCLYDCQLTDDALRNELAQFREGQRVCVVSDSCHSESITRVVALFADQVRNRRNDAEVTVALEALEQEYWNQFAPKGDRKVRSLSPKQAFSAMRAQWPTCRSGGDAGELAARVLTLSAAKDCGKAYDGVYTTKLNEVWIGKGEEGYAKFQVQVRDRVREIENRQDPCYMSEGPADPAFENQHPFSVAVPLADGTPKGEPDADRNGGVPKADCCDYVEDFEDHTATDCDGEDCIVRWCDFDGTVSNGCESGGRQMSVVATESLDGPMLWVRWGDADVKSVQIEVRYGQWEGNPPTPDLASSYLKYAWSRGDELECRTSTSTNALSLNRTWSGTPRCFDAEINLMPDTGARSLYLRFVKRKGVANTPGLYIDRVRVEVRQ